MPQHTKNEVKAGALMLAGFVLLCIGIYTIADFKVFFLPKKTYHFSFDKVEGLKVDDDVMYAGIKCGRVLSIHYQDIRAADNTSLVGAAKTRVLVAAEIGSDVPLRLGDKPRLSRGLTGSVFMDIVPWRREHEDEPVSPLAVMTTVDNAIAGQHLPGLDEVGADAQVFIRKAQGELAKIGHILESVDNAAVNARKITADIRDLVARNTGKVDSIVNHVNKTTETAETMTTKFNTDVQTIVTDAQETIKRARDTVARAQARIEEILPKMTEIVDKVNDSATNVKTTTVDVKAAAVDVKATAKEVRELVVDNRHNIDGTIEELRQAAARLNLGMEDIRRNPWKLLSRNIEADAYTQNIYDASMEFAEGARTLSLASGNLRAMASQPNADPEKVKKATEEISRLVAEMSKLQAKLYEAMKARPR